MQENETNFGRNQLRTISMSELYEHIYPGKTPIIDGMLYGGTYLFVGAPKIGKAGSDHRGGCENNKHREYLLDRQPDRTGGKAGYRSEGECTHNEIERQCWKAAQ